MLVTKEASVRSIESGGSASSGASSSACSDDPAMKRTERRSGGRRPKREKVSCGGGGGGTTLAGCRSRRISGSGIVGGGIGSSEDGKVAPKAIIAAPRQRQRVRFSASLCQVVCEIRHREDVADDEKKEVYLTGCDMQKIRYDAKFITKYFRVKDTHAVMELDQAYSGAIARSAPTHYETHETFLQFMGNGDRQLEQVAAPLTQWCLKSKVSGRGLERYCSQRQRAERSAFSLECRQAVIRLYKSSSISAEDIAKFYHEYARGTTVWARLMGHADEIAAKEAVLQMTREDAAQAAAIMIKIPDEVLHRHAPTKGSRLQNDKNWHARNELREQHHTLNSDIQEAHSLMMVQTPPQSSMFCSHPPNKSPPPQTASPLDRRKLLLLSKQQSSSSARLIVDRLGRRASSQRMNFV